MDRVWFAKICLMFILIHILPFHLMWQFGGFIYASPLIHLGNESPFMRDVTSFSITLSVMLAFFVSIPAIYSNYLIHSRPAGKSVTKPLFIAIIMSQPIVLVLLTMPIVSYMATRGMEEFAYAVLNAIVSSVFAVNWFLLIMVLVPLLQRSVDYQYRKNPYTKSSNILDILRKASRLTLIATILGIFVILIPMVGTQQTMWYVDGPIILGFISAAGLISIDPINFLFTFSSVSAIYYPFTFISTALHFSYLKNVMGYLQGTSLRSRCISTGLLALGGASISTMIPNRIVPSGLTLSIPIPITSIVGYNMV